jgi:hypothetical protein
VDTVARDLAGDGDEGEDHSRERCWRGRATWFALITDQAIPRGSFESVRQLEKAITKYLAAWNENAKPFQRTKSASQIRWRIRRAQDVFDARH